jgi:hypothetical protein
MMFFCWFYNLYLMTLDTVNIETIEIRKNFRVTPRVLNILDIRI